MQPSAAFSKEPGYWRVFARRLDELDQRVGISSRQKRDLHALVGIVIHHSGPRRSQRRDETRGARPYIADHEPPVVQPEPIRVHPSPKSYLCNPTTCSRKYSFESQVSQ